MGSTMKVANDNAVFVMNEVMAENKPQGLSPAPAELFNVENGGIEHALVASNETVTLSWEHLNAHVTPNQRPCCRKQDPDKPPKQILKDVYGHVEPGTLLAIIGASGAGKTTLMNMLTYRTNPSLLTTSGDIRINGVNLGVGIRNISAYVQQDDLFIATMTVREHLTFRALLRMEKEVPKRLRLERVKQVMTELGLNKCADNIIGDPTRNMKGISGGEMRRLSFASEILTNPPLLFCDEPTSGLDSYMAENIVLLLKSMSAKGKTIVCTIHQPSSEVFALFNSVCVMSEGRVAFMGKCKDALDFYKSVGFPCPVNFNPADFYIKTMAIVPDQEAACKAKTQTICDAFDKTEYSAAMKAGTQRANANPRKTGIIYEEAFSSTSRYEAPLYRQFAAVFIRSWKTTFRDAMVLRVKMAQAIAMSLVLGLIYLQLDLNQNGVMDINGVIFLVIINLSMTNLFSVLNSFPVEVPVFLRDYGIGLYRVDIYFFCKSLAELPGSLFIPFVYCTIVYWMVGLYESAEAYLFFVAVGLLVAACSISVGYIISAASNSVTTALSLAPPLFVPLIMFGGFFLNTESIPVYFIWLEYLSFFKYANELLALNQWENIGAIDCTSANATATCDKSCLFDDGDAVIKYLNFDQDNRTLDILCLFALLIGYRIIAFLVLLLKARLSKK